MYTPLVSEYRFDPSEDPKSATFDLMHHDTFVSWMKIQMFCTVREIATIWYSIVLHPNRSSHCRYLNTDWIRSSGLRKKNRWFCLHPILDARVMWKQWRAF